MTQEVQWCYIWKLASDHVPLSVCFHSWFLIAQRMPSSQAVEATNNVERGNKELSQAIQRNSSSRTFLLLFFFVLTFSVLFLDWYSKWSLCKRRDFFSHSESGSSYQSIHVSLGLLAFYVQCITAFIICESETLPQTWQSTFCEMDKMLTIFWNAKMQPYGTKCNFWTSIQSVTLICLVWGHKVQLIGVYSFYDSATFQKFWHHLIVQIALSTVKQ
jgi:hypothetical protein